MVNGNNARLAVICATILLTGLILATAGIVIFSEDQIPADFGILMGALGGALAGFLAGTRVVPPDVSTEIKTQSLNQAERVAIAEQVIKEENT